MLQKKGYGCDCALVLIFLPHFPALSQVQCGEIEVEKKIDETIEHFISWIDKHPNKKSQVSPFPFTLYLYTSILVLTRGLNVW